MHDIFVDNRRPRNQHRQFGSLHLKCAIADDSLLFTSSANFTGHAFDLNVEFGVLIRGGGMVKWMQRHFSELITDGVPDTTSLSS